MVHGGFLGLKFVVLRKDHALLLSFALDPQMVQSGIFIPTFHIQFIPQYSQKPLF